MSFNFISTIQKPTAVTHSLTGHFTSPVLQNLIIAKCTKIEIYLLTPEGLQPVLESNIYGRISSMNLLRCHGETTDLLFILTERYKFCLLSYDYERNELVTVSSGDAEDMIGRPTESGHIVAIDPDSKIIGMHLYEGLLKLAAIERDRNGLYSLKDAFNIRLNELQVIDITFLNNTMGETSIAILSMDSKYAKHVTIYNVSLRDKELYENPWSQTNVEDGAIKLLPLHGGSLLVVGEMLISYLTPDSAPQNIPISGVKIVAIEKIDKYRYLFGDVLGGLYLLVLMHDKETNSMDMKWEYLGDTCQASSISYLDNSVVYIGSDAGDSQLIRLLTEKESTDEAYFTVLDTFTNLGPITDFCVVNTDKQGQGQLVTCSGRYKDGSLRVIRNGIGITELASVDLEGIKGIWSLTPNSKTSSDKYLVLSFIGSTKVLAFNDEGEIEETDIDGFDNRSPTLYCGNLDNNQYIQISTSGIYLVDATTLQRSSSWKPQKGSINLCSRNSNQIVVSYGKTLIYFEINNNNIQLITEKQLEYEISCLDISAFDGQSKSRYCSVGLWTSISILLLELPSLELIHKEPLGGEVIPRSILMITFEGINYILCSLGDGHLFNFRINIQNNTLHDKKKLSLGTTPIILNKFTLKNTINVFASSDRPTVIYSNNKKLLYSIVNFEVITHVTSFNSPAYQDSIAVTTENTLTIGRIDEIQKLHIKKVDLGGEMARRITYIEKHQCYAAITIKHSDPGTDSDNDQNSIRLFNDQTFETLSKYPLKEYEFGWSIINTTFKPPKTQKNTDSNNNNNNNNNRMEIDDDCTYLVVGTIFHSPEDKKSTKGRILVFTVHDNRLLLLEEYTSNGSVYCLIPFNGAILACINKYVYKFTWNGDSNGGKLVGQVVHNGHSISLKITSRSDFIMVSDMIKSITILQDQNVSGTSNIKELARNLQALWITAAEFIDDESYLVSDNCYNLVVMKKNSDSTNELDNQLLDTVGHIHLGELVNVFRHGSLVTHHDTDTKPIPTILYASINGAIGAIANIPKEEFDFFSKLQVGLSRVVPGVGGFLHEKWRSFHNDHQSTALSQNFIDGDLIEMFLYLGHEKMLEVIKNMDVSVDETYKRIESIFHNIR